MYLKNVCMLSICVCILLCCATRVSEYARKEGNATKIEQVENGLLPPVLIRGEKPYTLPERMIYYKVPGLSIAVIKDFKIEWVKHYGVMDGETQERVTDETMFGVGSLSKAVAAMAVLKKVEEGKIELNGNVNDQLITWKIPENEFTRKTPITVKHLLNHCGGLNVSPSPGYTADNMPTLIQVLNGEKPAITEPAHVDKEPGTVYQYSNHGYAILQQLLIDVEHKPFPEIVKEAVFEPLGMKQSTFEQPLSQQWLPFAASGHMSDGTPITGKRLYLPRMAAGGLWTTTNDLAKFIIEVQLSFHGKSNKVLSAETMDEMFTPFVSENYGLGIGVSKMNGEIYLRHFGDIIGFFAGFVWHKTDGYGAVVVSNSNNGFELEREILRGIARVNGWQGYLPEEFETVEIEPDLLGQYTGRYLAGSDNVLTVFVEDGTLYMITTSTGKMKLFPIAQDKCVIKEREGGLTFVQDASGAVVEAIHQFTYPLDQFASREFRSKKLIDDYKVPLELLMEGKIEDAIAGYHKIKKDNPDDYYVSEMRLNTLGYNLLHQEKYREAIAVFRVNVELYPESWNVYDSQAEAYMLNGDTELAIENYEKSLELNPSNAGAIEKLKKLREE